MKRALGLLLAAVVLLPHVNAQVQRQRERLPRLVLTIRADQTVYTMKDTVRLETQLTNAGTETLYLFDDVCWNPMNSLNVHVTDMAGREVSGKLDFLRDCLPPPPPPNDTSRFIRLEPDTFYGVIEKFSIKELVPGPGEYDVAVWYTPALSADWIKQFGGQRMKSLRIWTREMPLQSIRVHITVKS